MVGLKDVMETILSEWLMVFIGTANVSYIEEMFSYIKYIEERKP